MNKVEFIGKTLLITNGKERIIVIGDLHLGYEEGLRNTGVRIPFGIKDTMMADLKNLFDRVGEVERIVLLGDVKHSIGFIMRDEWSESDELISFLSDKTKEIIIVRGNHDVLAEPIMKKKNIKMVDYYIFEEIAFLHGDKDFDTIHSKEIKIWVVGHAHPAIELNDNVKSEKYKCFLDGKYMGRRVIVVPSFLSANEGSDLRDFDSGLAWNLNLRNFEVRVVGEDLKVLDFGKLGKIRN